MILLAGGAADPNITHLARRVAQRRLPHFTLRIAADAAPRLDWRFADDSLRIDGVVVRPSALFLRHDVFTHSKAHPAESRPRASRWYQTLLSWGLAHEEAALPNRRYGTRHPAKPWVLHLARRFGLPVPETLIGNDPGALDRADAEGWIVKPVNGGEYTRTLADAQSDSDWRRRAAGEPTILQRRLVPPELRLYRVGPRWFAFQISAPVLDYRTTRDVEVTPVPVPEALARPLGRLMERMGLDFGAADFKSCPESGRLLFLEVNSAPMFVAFDKAAQGALGDALLDWLAAGGDVPPVSPSAGP